MDRIYIGALCNRDMEIFEKQRILCKKNYNISIINLFKKGSNSFNAKYLRKKLKKYSFSLFIVKLFSSESNQKIYNVINEVAPNIPVLNSLNSVKMCERRSDTFKFIEQKCKKLTIPRSFYSFNEAYNACSKGIKIIIKLDKHNIANLDKNDRIIGIAKNPDQLQKLIKNFRENELFYQEYLGKFDIIYKVYVIDRWVVSINSHNRLQHKEKLSPLELVHIRVPIAKQLKRRILRLGRKTGMSTFGVDYILAKDGKQYVVDINDFPSYRRIPEALSLISDYIYNTIAMQQALFRRTVKAKG